jgi:hypothetical protein
MYASFLISLHLKKIKFTGNCRKHFKTIGISCVFGKKNSFGRKVVGSFADNDSRRQIPVSSNGQFTQSSGDCATIGPNSQPLSDPVKFSPPSIHQPNGFTYRVTEISEHAWRLLRRKFTTFRSQLQMLMISSSPSKKLS